ncbi:hypothetical protein M153_1143000315, partial [Pseudoloma neurophilia]
MLPHQNISKNTPFSTMFVTLNTFLTIFKIFKILFLTILAALIRTTNLTTAAAPSATSRGNGTTIAPATAVNQSSSIAAPVATSNIPVLGTNSTTAAAPSATARKN